MTPEDFLRILARRWPFVLLPIALIAVLTVATTPATPPTTYAVTMRFAAGLPPEPRRDEAYGFDQHYNWLASEYITRALSQATETGRFAENVNARLAAAGVSAAVAPGVIRSEYLASYMRITVSWPDAAQAVAIANAVDEELRRNGAAYWPQLSGASAEPVRLLDVPVAAPVPPPLRSRFDLPVRALLGLAAGLVLAFAVHYLDPVIRDPREIERAGLKILGRANR
jgi:capsular polysaccharide biosynthesis protein